MQPEPVVMKSAESSLVPKETEKQLSNKERKKKELAEHDAFWLILEFPRKKVMAKVSLVVSLIYYLL